MSSILGDSYTTVGDVDITVDIDPIWLTTAKYNSGTFGDLWSALTAGWNISTTLTALFSPLMEEGITEEVRPMYAATDVPGRAESYQTYMGSSNRIINIHFVFHAQVTDGFDLESPNLESPPDYSPGWVVLMGRWLDLLKQPVYDPDWDLSYAPPPVILRVGNLLVARCIMTGGSPRWGGPFDTDTMYPYNLDYSAQFTVVRNAPLASGDTDPYDDFIGTVTPAWNRFVRFDGTTSG